MVTPLPIEAPLEGEACTRPTESLKTCQPWPPIRCGEPAIGALTVTIGPNSTRIVWCAKHAPRW